MRRRSSLLDAWKLLFTDRCIVCDVLVCGVSQAVVERTLGLRQSHVVPLSLRCLTLEALLSIAQFTSSKDQLYLVSHTWRQVSPGSPRRVSNECEMGSRGSGAIMSRTGPPSYSDHILFLFCCKQLYREAKGLNRRTTGLPVSEVE